MTAVGYVGGDPTKVSRSGDTMTGDLTLPGNPDQPLEAAPKQYVDAAVAGGGPVTATVLTLTETTEPASPVNASRIWTEDQSGVTETHYVDPLTPKIHLLSDAVLTVRNSSGGPLAKGAVVYVNGVHSGTNIDTVDLARADSPTTMPAVGIVLSAIASNDFGRILRAGHLENVNTAGYAVSDRLYVSATSAGTLTNVAPIAPNLSQVVGVVSQAHASNGIIHVNVRQALNDSTGCRAASWSVGDGTAGAKSIRFNGAGALLLQATPTTARTVTIPDASGAVLLGPDNQVEQVVAWSALDRWLRVNTPFSAGDTNPDLLRIFNGTNQVWRLNGNGENRWLPSDINRVGGRAFEFQDGSNDIFWECSTNPTTPGVRETLLGVYGTLHATRPGWVLVRETVLAKALQTSSPITVSGNATYPGTGWQNATLNANVSAGTAVAPGSQLEGRRVFLRGRLSWVSQTFAAGTVLMTVHANHQPQTTKTFSVRTSANSSVAVILELASNGQLTNNATLGTTTTAFLGLDGLNYDLS